MKKVSLGVFIKMFSRRAKIKKLHNKDDQQTELVVAHHKPTIQGPMDPENSAIT
jgi:hypothetical protein